MAESVLARWDADSDALPALLGALPAGPFVLVFDSAAGTLGAGTRGPGVWAEAPWAALGLSADADAAHGSVALAMPSAPALLAALRGIAGLPSAEIVLETRADASLALRLRAGAARASGGAVEHVVAVAGADRAGDAAAHRAAHEAVGRPAATFALSPAADSALFARAPHLARLAPRVTVAVGAAGGVALSVRAPLLAATVRDAGARTATDGAPVALAVPSHALCAALRAAQRMGAAVRGAALPGAELVVAADRADDVRLLFRIPAAADETH